MLLSLNIKNFILVDSITIDFKKGLTSIVGETGAGKSMIVKALTMLFAKKVDTQVIRNKEKLTIITGEFDVSSNKKIQDYLRTYGFSEENDKVIILRRIIGKGTRNKVFINDQLATTKNLKRLKEGLCEIYSQHDQSTLRNVASHIEVIDGALNINKELGDLAKQYDQIKILEKSKEELAKDEQNNKYEITYLKSSIEELKALNIQEEEKKELEAKRKKLSESANIVEISQVLSQALHNREGSILSELWSLQKQFTKLPETLGMHSKKLEKVINELEELHGEMEQLSNELMEDIKHIDEIENRYYKIKEVERKYKIESQDFANHIEVLEKKLEELEDRQYYMEEIEKKLKISKEGYYKQAKEVSSLREETAVKLREDILSHMNGINMGKLDIKIEIKKKEKITKKGIDEVEILVRTNPGSEFVSIDKAASGGELSRIMLGLKLACNKVNDQNTIILDEIDAGTGGKTAGMIGKKLKELSKTKQVIVITHQAQIAAGSDKIVLINKEYHEDKATIKAKLLEEQEIKHQVAYMISGSSGDEKVMETAESIIKEMGKG